jgi:glutaredoxin 3
MSLLLTQADHTGTASNFCCKIANSFIQDQESMPRVTLYSTGNCTICEKAKSMLSRWNIDYTEIRIDTDKSALKEYGEVTLGARTVPQILIDGKLIGGFSELTELHMDGELDEFMTTE